MLQSKLAFSLYFFFSLFFFPALWIADWQVELARSISEYAGFVDANVLQYTWPENFDKYRILLVRFVYSVNTVWILYVYPVFSVFSVYSCVLHIDILVILLNLYFTVFCLSMWTCKAKVIKQFIFFQLWYYVFILLFLSFFLFCRSPGRPRTRCLPALCLRIETGLSKTCTKSSFATIEVSFLFTYECS